MSTSRYFSLTQKDISVPPNIRFMAIRLDPFCRKNGYRHGSMLLIRTFSSLGGTRSRCAREGCKARAQERATQYMLHWRWWWIKKNWLLSTHSTVKCWSHNEHHEGWELRASDRNSSCQQRRRSPELNERNNISLAGRRLYPWPECRDVCFESLWVALLRVDWCNWLLSMYVVLQVHIVRTRSRHWILELLWPSRSESTVVWKAREWTWLYTWYRRIALVCASQGISSRPALRMLHIIAQQYRYPKCNESPSIPFKWTC